MAARTTRVKSRAKRKTQLVNGNAVPLTDLERRFCEHWIQHYDAVRAAKDSGNTTHGARLYRKFSQHLLGLKAKKEKEVIKTLVLDQKDILAEMASIAFLDPLDYFEAYTETVNKEAVTRFRQKPLHQLTRGQRAAIYKVTIANGVITYRLPNINQKHAFLKDLGQHVGLFNEKLIHEHRHQHLHAAMSFRGVDAAKLEEAEQLLISAMGNEGRRMLGLEVIDAEYSEVEE